MTVLPAMRLSSSALDLSKTLPRIVVPRYVRTPAKKFFHSRFAGFTRRVSARQILGDFLTEDIVGKTGSREAEDSKVLREIFLAVERE